MGLTPAWPLPTDLAPVQKSMASTARDLILTSSSDQPIAAHDPITGATLAHFSGSRSPRGGLALAGNGLIAASHISSDATGFINLYNWWSTTPLRSIPTAEPVASLTATSDGSFLFAGGLSGRVHAFSLPSGDPHCSFRAHPRPVSCLAVNDDGSLLISGGDDGKLAVFLIIRLLDASAKDNTDDAAELALYRFAAHESSITGIAPGPGGCNAIVISSSMDCLCRIWSLAKGSHLCTVRFPCGVWCVVADHTGSGAYAGGSDGRVYSLPMAVSRPGAEEVEAVPWASERGEAVTAVAMANADQNLVAASEDGVIRIWGMESRSVVRVLGVERVGGISDLLVANGVAGANAVLFRNGLYGGNHGFSERKMSMQVAEVSEMQKCLIVAEKDRRRAIDTLEAAIDNYRRLMVLLLKETKRADKTRDLE